MLTADRHMLPASPLLAINSACVKSNSAHALQPSNTLLVPLSRSSERKLRSFPGLAGLAASGVPLLLGIHGSPGPSTGHCSSLPVESRGRVFFTGYFRGFWNGENLDDLDLSVPHLHSHSAVCVNSSLPVLSFLFWTLM